MVICHDVDDVQRLLFCRFLLVCTKFARVTTNNELIPQNRGKDTGVWYDENYENDLKSNIFSIKEKIENGDFRFDSNDDTYCGYCEINNMCNKNLLNKGI
jgi:hypothetical protein